jgi:hypothetical protein
VHFKFATDTRDFETCSRCLLGLSTFFSSRFEINDLVLNKAVIQPCNGVSYHSRGAFPAVDKLGLMDCLVNYKIQPNPSMNAASPVMPNVFDVVIGK